MARSSKETPRDVQTEPPKLGISELLAVADEEQTELDKILELMLDPRNIEHNTDLNRNEILAFSVLSSLAPKHDLEALSNFLQKNLILRVSKGRKGRAEWVKILSREMQQPDSQMMIPQNGIRRMFGRGNQRR